jgi:hypothetical protein
MYLQRFLEEEIHLFFENLYHGEKNPIKTPNNRQGNFKRFYREIVDHKDKNRDRQMVSYHQV